MVLKLDVVRGDAVHIPRAETKKSFVCASTSLSSHRQQGLCRIIRRGADLIPGYVVPNDQSDKIDIIFIRPIHAVIVLDC